MKSLYIIIPVYNPDEHLENLLSSLKKNISKLNNSSVDTIIVDNNSEDSALPLLNKLYQKYTLKIIKKNKNLGFAKAANTGIKEALKRHADRILIINQDVYLEADFLKSFLLSDYDISSPVIVFERYGKQIFDYGGKINWLLGRTYHLESAREKKRYSSKEIEYVSGCCMLIRPEVFKEIGYFDERFFMYFEDVDFCLRAQKAGFSLGIVHNSYINHQLEEGNKKSIDKKLYQLRSNYYFINKHLGIKKIFGYIYLTVLSLKIFIIDKIKI